MSLNVFLVQCLLVFFLFFLFLFFFSLFVLRESLDLERWGSKKDLEGDEGGKTVIIIYEKKIFSIRKNKQTNKKALFFCDLKNKFLFLYLV